jgi:hypothetical protein
MTAYLKAFVPVVLGALYALQAAVSDDVITKDEWIGIALAAVIALGVWATPNKPPGATP